LDFFERQDKAKRHTAFLVCSFTLAVILTVGSVCLLVGLLTGMFDSKSADKEALSASDRATVVVVTGFATLGVIGAGSFFKTLSLARGGRAVAEMLDGRLVNSNSTDVQERKLLNVVEEMAIASGVPVPQVYVMDGERCRHLRHARCDDDADPRRTARRDRA
jgi:hypothetical protein